MTRLQSACMHRRWTSVPAVSEAHIGFQPKMTKLPSSWNIAFHCLLLEIRKSPL